MVSILTNNAEGQVGSQSSNLPLTDTGDKKTGEEFFEVKKNSNFPFQTLWWACPSKGNGLK